MCPTQSTCCDHKHELHNYEVIYRITEVQRPEILHQSHFRRIQWKHKRRRLYIRLVHLIMQRCYYTLFITGGSVIVGPADQGIIFEYHSMEFGDHADPSDILEAMGRIQQ